MSAIHYRPDIQGLRAIAVLAVMMFHLNPAWLPGGFVGVDVFLVISGFLIVSILLSKKAQPGYRLAGALQYFYTSRLKRIAPAYFVMLVLVSLLAAVLFLPQDLAIYRQGLKQAAWFHSNTYFASFGDYFAPASHEQPLLHTWSLAVEIQFYLLAPLLVLLVPVNALKWLLGALFIGFSALAEYRLRILGIEQATYYSLYARLPEFFAGGLVALYAHSGKNGRPWLSTFGLALVLAAAAVQPRLGHFPGLPALLPMAGAAFVLLHSPQGIAGQLLSSRPMAWVGKMSYSLYLWHWPVLALLRYYTGVQVLDMSFSLLFIAFTLLLATLSFYWVETPLRTRNIHRKQVLGYGLLACAGVVTVLGMAKLNQTLSPPSLSVEYQRYADPKTICHGQMVGDCLKGDLSSSKEVLVLGDSHAAMLNLFFDSLGKELGFKARIITASSCVTIPGFDYQRIAEWAHEACLKQIKEADMYIDQAQTIFIAGMWSWQLQSDTFKNALIAFLKKRAPQARKYLISQVPMLNKNPMRNQRFNALGLGGLAGRNNDYLSANRVLENIAGDCCKAAYLKLDDLDMFKQIPIYQGDLIYYDESHMNEIGAMNYARLASRTFESIFK
jgi:peptidoglycan/LPS O-acetylase OafA/YrhL